MGHDGRFVGLGVRADLHPRRRGEAGHRVEIRLEGVEIDDEGRRIDLVDRHAGGGGRRL